MADYSSRVNSASGERRRTDREELEGGEEWRGRKSLKIRKFGASRRTANTKKKRESDGKNVLTENTPAKSSKSTS